MRTETVDATGDVIFMEDVNECASEITQDINVILREKLTNYPDCLTKMMVDEVQDKIWDVVQTRIDILLDFPEYKGE
jgi:hypothetical protein